MTALREGATYSVALRVDGAAADVQRAAIAAVPGRFRLTREPVAEVVVLDAVAWAWPDLLDRAIGEGARGVLFAGRALASPTAARAALDRAALASVPVVFHTPFAAAVAWRAVEGAIAADASAAHVLDSVVTWPVALPDEESAAGRALLDQLAVIRPLLEAEAELRVVHRTVGGYEIVGGDALVVTLTGVEAPHRWSRLDLDLVSPSLHWRIRFDAGAPAAPISVERMDADGSQTRPLRFESAARALWASLHAQLTGASPVTVDQAFLDDLELAEPLIHPV
jgi:hypothetical protein